jgi:hypothetical protein
MMRRYLLIPLATTLMAMPAQASFGDNFGSHGSDGADGRSGRSGRSASDQTFFINNAPANLDLVGSDGEDGDDGRDGERAYCAIDRHHDEIDDDLRGASGGDGGNGGNGGDGGNGGNVTLYYQSLTDLRNVLVRAQGGRGGRAGRGGYGANGCNCHRHRWHVKKCTGTGAEQKCHTESYSCTDGRDGRGGRYGSDGRQGHTGQLTLIPGTTQLKPDNPKQQATLATWSQQSIALSQNRWQTNTGATSLLAPGSTVTDRYTFLAERVERSVQMKWQAPTPVQKFADLNIGFQIDADKNTQIQLPEKFWAKSTIEQSGNQVTMTVQDVMYRDEALRLGVAGLRGAGNRLSVKLLDVALQTNRVNTGTIQLQYRVKQNDGSLSNHFTGEIPAQYVNARANELVLELGKLPIDPTALQAGKSIDLVITVGRSFGRNAANQVIRWEGVIGALPEKK